MSSSTPLYVNSVLLRRFCKETSPADPVELAICSICIVIKFPSKNKTLNFKQYFVQFYQMYRHVFYSVLSLAAKTTNFDFGKKRKVIATTFCSVTLGLFSLIASVLKFSHFVCIVSNMSTKDQWKKWLTEFYELNHELTSNFCKV